MRRIIWVHLSRRQVTSPLLPDLPEPGNGSGHEEILLQRSAVLFAHLDEYSSLHMYLGVPECSETPLES